MLALLDRRIGGRRIEVVATDRADGDVHPHAVPPVSLRRRQVALTGRPWVMVDQVHGVGCHRVRPGDERRPTAARADVLVVDDDVDAAVWAADCASIWLLTASGRRVGLHAGWRGLAAGVVDAAVAEVDSAVVAAVLGPCIHHCCYEFGDAERRLVAAGVGATESSITAPTSSGRPGLDVPAAVAAGLERHGIELDAAGPCTGCDRSWFSHRVRREDGRHALVARVRP